MNVCEDLLLKITRIYESFSDMLTPQFSKNITEDLIEDRVALIFHKSQGGAPTYTGCDNAELKDIDQIGNTRILEKSIDFLIIGAGPNGMFLSYMLKRAMPWAEVSIVENRTAQGARKLSRIYKLVISAFFSKSLYRLLQENDLLLDPSRPFIKYSDFIDSNDRPVHRVNSIECKLAVKAQSVGVNIYHESNTMMDLESYLHKFPTSIAVFDATGGRLHVNGREMDRSFVKQVIDDEPDASRQEGVAPSEYAVRSIPNSSALYVAVGDTCIVADHYFAAGFLINWTLILMYVVCLKQCITVNTGGRKKRTSRRLPRKKTKKRRGRSVSFS
jgi:hypothetical protein